MLSRRALIEGSIAGSGAMLLPGAVRAAWRAGDPFALGIASGEPTADGVVLWTRLAPQPLAPDGGMPARAVPVTWEIATRADFADARRGTAIARPEWGHAVHVEVNGLRPARAYHYRFIAGGEVSAAGVTRTAPAPGTPVDRLRLAFGSCQNFEAGHYAAHAHIARSAPDLVVFLGDYIYESAPRTGKTRVHPTPQPTDIGGYRARYGAYKSDPLLQAAHAAAPWLMTWDDHEVEDNYAGALDKRNGDPVAFLKLRAAAYQAYWEHMPLRRVAHPHGPAMQLYRTLDWGDLAQFQILDDRQYRDPPPCQPPEAVARHVPTIWLTPDCAERHDPRRTILGGEQEAWLDRALLKTQARWNLLTQQTLMLPYTRIPPDTPDAAPSVHNTDSWDGYPAAHARIVRRWRDAATPNPVILSGDIHAFVAADHADPDDPARLVASEFVGGSITSVNHDPTLKQGAARNPGFRYAENAVRGYASVELTPAACHVAFRGVVDPADPASAVRDIARFTIEAGRAGMQLG